MHILHHVCKWDPHLQTLTIWSQTCNQLHVTLDTVKPAF